MASAGDVNSDGYDDIIVSALYYDNGETDEGRDYVYLGSAVGLSASPDWTYESNQASALLGAGTAVAGIGDVNGDGYDDVLVGAQNYDNGETDEGQVYLFYGSAAGLSTVPDWTAESNQAGATFGWAVDAAGDVNQDGYADFLIGADQYEVDGTSAGSAIAQAGRVYLYFGSATGPGIEPDWTAAGTQANGRFGHDVGSAGDVNGDGVLEIIIGEQRYSNGETQEGRALVYEAYALAQTETTITYDYDPLYRLTQATYTGSIDANYDYDYDAVGNMTAYTETEGVETAAFERTFDQANQLQSTSSINGGIYLLVESYDYDANGNLVRITPRESLGGLIYVYDQRNLLVHTSLGNSVPPSTPIADYIYDGDGTRVQQVENVNGTPITTTYTNDILGLSQVLVASNGVTTTHNLFGLDLISQQTNGQTSHRFLLADGLGSARTEMVGNAVETVTTYEPYGNLLTQTGTSGTTYGFTGEQHDAATGLLYLRARYYNPALSVFLSADPWRGSVWQPATLHSFSYVHGNPVNYIDPTGLCTLADVDAGLCPPNTPPPPANSKGIFNFQVFPGQPGSETIAYIHVAYRDFPWRKYITALAPRVQRTLIPIRHPLNLIDQDPGCDDNLQAAQSLYSNGTFTPWEVNARNIMGAMASVISSQKEYALRDAIGIAYTPYNRQNAGWTGYQGKKDLISLLLAGGNQFEVSADSEKYPNAYRGPLSGVYTLGQKVYEFSLVVAYGVHRQYFYDTAYGALEYRHRHQESNPYIECGYDGPAFFAHPEADGNWYRDKWTSAELEKRGGWLPLNEMPDPTSDSWLSPYPPEGCREQ